MFKNGDATMRMEPFPRWALNKLQRKEYLFRFISLLSALVVVLPSFTPFRQLKRSSSFLFNKNFSKKQTLFWNANAVNNKTDRLSVSQELKQRYSLEH